jgi:hypothetical protein
MSPRLWCGIVVATAADDMALKLTDTLPTQIWEREVAIRDGALICRRACAPADGELSRL